MIEIVKPFRLLAVAALSFAAWGPGCGTEDTTFCIPRAKQACTCDTGKSGSQTCLDDGSAFGECQCGEGMTAGAGGGGGAGGGMETTASGMPSQTAASSATASSATASSATASSSSSTGGGTGCVANDCKECLTTECAELACSTEIMACDAEPDCVGYEACLSSCQSVTCLTQCKMAYPAGPKYYSAKSTCIYCSPEACRDLCNTNNICK